MADPERQRRRESFRRKQNRRGQSLEEHPTIQDDLALMQSQITQSRRAAVAELESRLHVVGSRISEEQDFLGIKARYREFGRRILLLAFRGGPAVNKLRPMDSELDAALADKPESFRVDCLMAYADGLGVIDEGLPVQQFTYLRSLISKRDPSVRIFDNIRGDIPITPAACQFLKGKTIFMSKERQARLEEFLLDPQNNQRIRGNVRTDYDALEMVCLSALAPVYAEWMVQPR